MLCEVKQKSGSESVRYTALLCFTTLLSSTRLLLGNATIFFLLYIFPRMDNVCKRQLYESIRLSKPE
jgi:hypothetical protein